MAGYLDEYGVADARREQLRKRIIIWGVLAVIVGISAFFYFRNWGEERALDRFVTLLKQQKYQEAYQLWQTPDSAKFPNRALVGPLMTSTSWTPAGKMRLQSL